MSTTDQQVTNARGPEAGDTKAIAAIPISHHEQICCIPEALLAGYCMQWALNRTLTIINFKRTLQVNAYKLATKSKVFHELIRLNAAIPKHLHQTAKVTSRKRKVTMKNETHGILQHMPVINNTAIVGPTQLLVYCKSTPTCVGDLLFAVHFCHLENCQINGITELGCVVDHTEGLDRQLHQIQFPVEPVVSRVSRPTDMIYESKELCLWKHRSVCTLECGLRVTASYEVPDLECLCCQYARDVINPSTCWHLWRMAMTYRKADTSKFHDIVQEYIHTHFTMLMRNEPTAPLHTERRYVKFDQLQLNELEPLLSSDRLNVKCESAVVQAIQRWLQSEIRVHENPIYLTSVPRLLYHCVRTDNLKLNDIEILYKLPALRKRRIHNPLDSHEPQRKKHNDPTSNEEQLTQTDYLNTIRHVRRHLFRSSRNLRPLEKPVRVNKVSNIVLQDTEPNHKTTLNKAARIPHEAIFSFGGWREGRPCRDVCIYDSRMGRWITYGPESGQDMSSRGQRIVLSYALMSFGIVLIQNRYIYIAGGELHNLQTTNGVICYDLHDPIIDQRSQNNKESGSGWKTYPPMRESRRDLALVNTDDKRIYAIGGDNNRTVLNTVEYFNLDLVSQNKQCGWHEAPNMLMARGAPAADSLYGRLYVCGGYTESRMEALTSSCEVFCPIRNQWTFIQPMAQARYYAHAVAVSGVLFVLGGGGENESRGAARIARRAGYSSTVERYNPHTEMWELMPPTKERADFAACFFEDEIVCIGGGGEAFCTDEVESWRPWIPDSVPSPFTTTVSDQTNESNGPVWLSAAATNDGSNASGWKRCKALPFAVWGHRCVVPKGCDLLLPYLNRTPELNNNVETDARQASSKCIQINGQHVLMATEYCEDTRQVEHQEISNSDNIGNLCGQDVIAVLERLIQLLSQEQDHQITNEPSTSDITL